jgi:2-methylcitrate dehydratase PrpD
MSAPGAQAGFVAAHAARLDADLDPADARRLAVLCLDTWAIAHHARRHGVGGAGLGVTGLEAPGAAAVWGGGTAEPRAAAFLNGVAAEALDFQEVLIDGRNNGHAAVVIVPALFALAAAEGGDPDTLMRGLRAAFEANVLLARALGRGHRAGTPGFRTTALVAPLAAALGGGLMGGDAEAAGRALSIAAATLPAGLLAAMAPGAGDFSVDKDLSVGFSARHALEAVLLARAGAAGPSDALAGPRGWAASYGFGTEVPAHLGTTPASVDLGAYALKLYPVNFGAQCAVRLAIELTGGVGRAAPGDIVRAVVSVKSSSAESLSTRALPTHVAARFSLPYAVASALARGRSVLEDFDAAAIADPQVRALMDRVEIRGDATLERRHLAHGVFPARVELHLAGGEVRAGALDAPQEGLPAARFDAAFADKIRALVPRDAAVPLLASLEAGDHRGVIARLLR